MPFIEGRPLVVAFGGVVVHDIENTSSPAPCRAFTIALNSSTCRHREPIDCNAPLGAKKPMQLYPQ